MQDANLMSNRLQFNMIDKDTLAALREARPYILAELPGVLDIFYNHIPKFSETAKFFRDREHMKAAKKAQLNHWSHIADGNFDDIYAASVTTISETHHRLGLEPRWYIGGYSVLVTTLVNTIASKMLAKSTRAAAIAQCLRVQKAIIKAALLDMDLAISVYNDTAARQRAITVQVAVDMQNQVSGVVQSIQSTADELFKTAHVLTSSANDTSERSNTVATGAQQASNNVRTVAAAAEELSASVKEITRYTTSSNAISGQAVETAAQAMGKVEQLAEAAKKIGVIVDLINGIAGQTNLLALNATIEAARAGEAGRGFAVVAAEVKALAEQTAKATSEIGRQIGDIQSSTAESVTAINKISDTIKSMTEIATTIAGAVEEQGMATEEIARNVHEAAQGTNDVSANIGSVSKAATDTSATAEKVLNSADVLSRYASELRNAANSILEALRAA